MGYLSSRRDIFLLNVLDYMLNKDREYIIKSNIFSGNSGFIVSICHNDVNNLRLIDITFEYNKSNTEVIIRYNYNRRRVKIVQGMVTVERHISHWYCDLEYEEVITKIEDLLGETLPSIAYSDIAFSSDRLIFLNN